MNTRFSVLIVDDEELLRRVLVRFCLLEKVESATAATYGEAAQMIQSNGPFDMLITDFNLQDPNGLTGENVADVFQTWNPEGFRLGVSAELDASGKPKNPFGDIVHEFLGKPYKGDEIRRMIQLARNRRDQEQHPDQERNKE